MIFDPHLKVYMDVVFASGAQAGGNSTTQTPLSVGKTDQSRTQLNQNGTQVLGQSQINGGLEKHRVVVLDPLTEDQKFVEQIIEDANLKNNPEIQQLTRQSEDFI